MSVTFDFNFWTVLLFVLNFGLSIYALVSSRNTAAQQRVTKLEQSSQATEISIKTLNENITSGNSKKADLEHRLHKSELSIATLESQVKNSITHADLTNVYNRLNDLSKVVHKIDGSIEIISQQNSQILSALVTYHQNTSQG